MAAVLGAHSSAYLEERLQLSYRIETVRAKAILCTEYTVTYLWCRKRTFLCRLRERNRLKVLPESVSWSVTVAFLS